MKDAIDMSADPIQALTITIGGQLLAIPSANLREILDPLPRTRVPGACASVPWVLNVRGAVVPLAELRIPLGLDQPPPDSDATRRFVVLEVDVAGDRAVVAIIADSVHDVTAIPPGAIEPLPPASRFPPGFLTGIWRNSAGFVLLPDLSAIFTDLVRRSAAA